MQFHELALQKVLRFSPQHPSKSTLIAIASLVNTKKGFAWPNIETIAFRSGNTPRTVQRHIQHLEQTNQLTVDRSHSKRHPSNRYWISVCSMSIEELESVTPEASPCLPEADILTPQGCQNVAQIQTESEGIQKKANGVFDLKTMLKTKTQRLEDEAKERSRKTHESTFATEAFQNSPSLEAMVAELTGAFRAPFAQEPRVQGLNLLAGSTFEAPSGPQDDPEDLET